MPETFSTDPAFKFCRLCGKTTLWEMLPMRDEITQQISHHVQMCCICLLYALGIKTKVEKYSFNRSLREFDADPEVKPWMQNSASS